MEGANFGLAVVPPTPLDVSFEENTEQQLRDLGLLELAEQVLAQDPRPAYHQDHREYGTALGESNIRWRVEDEVLYVIEVETRL